MQRTILLLLIALLLAVPAAADPQITFLWSTEKSPVGPTTYVARNEVNTGYIVVQGADMLLGGAAFRLTTPPPTDLAVLGTWIADGVVIGDLLSGVEVGFYDPIAQFGATPAIIASFDFLVFDWGEYLMELGAHPDYASPMVADAGGVQTAAYGGVGTILAEPRPEVGVFLDPGATLLEGSYNGGPGELIDAWIVVRDLDYSFTWMGFSLELPPQFTLAEVEYAPEATVNFGGLPGDVSLVFSPTIHLPGDAAYTVARIRIAPGDEVLEAAEVRPGGYSPYGTGVPVFTNLGSPIRSRSLTTVLSIPVSNEDRTWGAVKSLY